MNGVSLGLALSGGGSLGAYQLGVLKALEENNFRSRITAVAGTSIGAINGAFFVGNQLSDLIHLWTNTPSEKIFTALNGHPNQDQLDAKAYQKLFWEFFSKLKVDISPFKNLLRNQLPESIIRSSNMRFFLNVWNVFKFRGETYELQDIPEGKLADYIIASSSFPVFRPHKIGSQLYLDGGIDINLPLTLPFNDKQVEHVIAVDVATFMKYRPKQLWISYQYKEKVTLIRPSKFIGSPAHFSQKIIQDQMALGYQDTLKVLEEFTQKIPD